MPTRRNALAIAGLTLAAMAQASHAAGAPANATPTLAAPNVVPISPTLVTSGQPSREVLSSLAQLGFQAVIYLAPLTLPDAVRDEPELLARQHIDFLNIPIAFDKPTAADFEAMAQALDRWKGRKVLVHCQVNMRASSMVFLYRVLRLKEPADPAYDAVTKVWTPRDVWRDLIVDELRRGGVDFEPY